MAHAMYTASLPLLNGSLRSKSWLMWAPVALGLAVLYIPTYIRLWNGVWSSEEQGHRPLILAVVAWLGWTNRSALIAGEPAPSGRLGWSLLLIGLLLYVLGRSQDILIFEVGAHILVMAGVLLAARGTSILRASFVGMVTYHIGASAGQGFLHGSAGMALFVAALSLLFLNDSALSLVSTTKRSQ